MSAEILVLAHAHDEGAAAVARAVATLRGGEAVVRLAPEVLGLAHWSHRVDTAGRASTQLTTPSGARLDSAPTLAVLNRVQYVPAPRFARAVRRDREYAAAELHALVTSWLAGLGRRVVNPIGDRAWGPGPGTPRGWLVLARSCGLPVARSAVATTGALLRAAGPTEVVRPRAPWPGGLSAPMPVNLGPRGDNGVASLLRVLVAGDEVLGEVPARVADGCRELARRSCCSLLELRFVAGGSGPALVGADTVPPLDRPESVALVSRLLDTVAA